MTNAKEKKYVVNSVKGGGWGLYEIKRSLTLPVAVFGQGDNDLADLICAFLNTGYSVEEILDMDPRTDVDGTPEKAQLNVDQFLIELSGRG